MSFMDDVSKAAGGMLGGASPQQAADAASDTVQNTDSGELAGHLTQSLGNMDGGTLSSLGGELLQSFTNHAGFSGDANSAAQAAGVSQDAVASGDPGAIGTLMQFAKGHPGVLQAAAGAFLQKNPGAISSLAPGLLQGVMGRLGGSGA